jgi:hypothetical protein
MSGSSSASVSGITSSYSARMASVAKRNTRRSEMQADQPSTLCGPAWWRRNCSRRPTRVTASRPQLLGEPKSDEGCSTNNHQLSCQSPQLVASKPGGDGSRSRTGGAFRCECCGRESRD